MANVLEKKWTWAEFREMDFDDAEHHIYELIKGNIVKRTCPNLPHQRVSREITINLGLFLRQNPIGEMFHAPTDVSLDVDTGVVPDIAFVSNERMFIYKGAEFIDGAPDVIMEIISPGNVRRDRVEKKALYEEYAVREFWLIDPYVRSVEIYVMRENRFVEHQFLETEGLATSTVITGFTMDLKTLFGA